MQMTEFGRVVSALMAEQGVRSQMDLVRLFRSHGYTLTQGRLSHWLLGRYAVAKDFPAQLTEVLALDEEQKMKLAVAFAFGQGEPAKASQTATCIHIA